MTDDGGNKRTIFVEPRFLAVGDGKKEKKGRNITMKDRGGNIHKKNRTGGMSESSAADREARIADRRARRMAVRKHITNRHRSQSGVRWAGKVNSLSEQDIHVEPMTELEQSIRFINERKSKPMRDISKNTRTSHKTQKRPMTSIDHTGIQTDLPESLIVSSRDFADPIINSPINIQKSHEPQYGCLKNGRKPTYRDWVKTRKNNGSENEVVSSNFTKSNECTDVPMNQPTNQPMNQPTNQPMNQPMNQPTNVPMNQPTNQPTNVPTTIITPTIEQTIEPPYKQTIEQTYKPTIEPPYKQTIGGDIRKQSNKMKRVVRNTTSKIKSTYGKLGDGKIGVVIRNRSTRKMICNEKTALKKVSIGDIKAYLRKHNLIKYGSQAPNNVLREIYEQSILSGDIINKSSDNLVHNFMS